MTDRPYTPRPGSASERAYHLLLARGCEVAAPELADAIDLEPASGLHASLSTAVQYGFMLKRVANGTAYYRLPGVEPAVDKPTGAAEASRRPGTAKETAQQGAVTQAVDAADERRGDDATREVEPAAPRGSEYPPESPVNRLTRAIPTSGRSATTPEDGGAPQGMRVALWSDNELVIERAGQPRIVFGKAETRQLLDYLFRMEGQGA